MSSNEPNLDKLHRAIVLPIGDMFSRPIQSGVLNRTTLIRGLTNMRIHKEIENYFCFTELTLNNLNLENVDIIGDYVSLKKLVLRQNSIKDLSVLNCLNELEYLDVSYNCLERIFNFSPSKMLYHVDYSYNNIEQMDDLTSFWSLAYLNLSHNVIKNVDGLQELKYLRFLNLSHNCIKQINCSLPKTLTEINLSYNDLENIQLNLSSSMCEILNVSHNKLKLLNFLRNAEKLSVLNIQNNMIDDVLQIKYLKQLTNLHVLSAENNEFFETNIHKQIFSNNLPIKSIINQTFIKTENMQEFNDMESYSILKAKKNAIKSTVLEHLSGRSPIGGKDCNPYNNCRSLPMVILVGPPKTRKKYFSNQIFMKHEDKFYQPIIYTTNEKCKNRIFKPITAQEFSRINCSGEFVFSYRFLGHFYGLSEDQINRCSNQNKTLITFTNLEGALSLKLKGYNPIFVLVLPEDESVYKKTIYQSIERNMIKNNSLTENETWFKKEKSTKELNATNNKSNSPNPTDLHIPELFSVCSLETYHHTPVEKTKIILQNDHSDDPITNDLCKIFTNECINNLKISYNLYEKSADIFHSLVYVDDFQNALKEITAIAVEVHNKYKNNKNSETQNQPTKHTLAHIQARHKRLLNELFT